MELEEEEGEEEEFTHLPLPILHFTQFFTEDEQGFFLALYEARTYYVEQASNALLTLMPMNLNNLVFFLQEYFDYHFKNEFDRELRQAHLGRQDWQDMFLYLRIYLEILLRQLEQPQRLEFLHQQAMQYSLPRAKSIRRTNK